jgi:hypothetical protein
MLLATRPQAHLSARNSDLPFSVALVTVRFCGSEIHETCADFLDLRWRREQRGGHAYRDSCFFERRDRHVLEYVFLGRKGGDGKWSRLPERNDRVFELRANRTSALMQMRARSFQSSACSQYYLSARRTRQSIYAPSSQIVSAHATACSVFPITSVEACILSASLLHMEASCFVFLFIREEQAHCVVDEVLAIFWSRCSHTART